MRRTLKGLFDRLTAFCLLLLLAPALVTIALLVLVADGAPVLHREARVGLCGKTFSLLKFRSMITTDGPGIATADDPRITRLGGLLRRSRLDELPQLLNVLLGDMSLVGPRPMTPRHAARVSQADADVMLSVRPGVTGASALAFIGDDAALCGRADAEADYFEHVLPGKVALELDYLRHWTLRADARLLARTLAQLWSRAAHRRSRRRVSALLDNR